MAFSLVRGRMVAIERITSRADIDATGEQRVASTAEARSALPP
jgi:hypothetical protein